MGGISRHIIGVYSSHLTTPHPSKANLMKGTIVWNAGSNFTDDPPLLQKICIGIEGSHRQYGNRSRSFDIAWPL